MKFFKQKETYISEQMRLCGDIETDADISIDGRMYGNILSKGHVMLGPTAHFEGNIESDSVLICGCFQGSVMAKRLIEVKIPADIVGDLIADSVRVDSGVAIQGKICAKTIQAATLQSVSVAAGSCSETEELLSGDHTPTPERECVFAGSGDRDSDKETDEDI